MASPLSARPIPDEPPLPVVDGMPILYEDEEEGDMGESNPHTRSTAIVHTGVTAHLANQPEWAVFANLNCNYRRSPLHPQTGSVPYVSPDVMVVRPHHDLGANVSSYTIGTDGPAPVLVVEVLSQRSAQQRDLREKLVIYARLGVKEYILVDGTGRFLPERLLLKSLQRNQRWKDNQDPDGGVTSRLGFRLIWDADGQLRVLDIRTGKRYARPQEAQQEADARLRAEEKIRELQTQLARLQSAAGNKPAPKRRRHQ